MKNSIPESVRFFHVVIGEDYSICHRQDYIAIKNMRKYTIDELRNKRVYENNMYQYINNFHENKRQSLTRIIDCVNKFEATIAYDVEHDDFGFTLLAPNENFNRVIGRGYAYSHLINAYNSTIDKYKIPLRHKYTKRITGFVTLDGSRLYETVRDFIKTNR